MLQEWVEMGANQLEGWLAGSPDDKVIMNPEVLVVRQ